MVVKNIIEEDFVNYKKPSMFIITPKCNFKCCRELGNDICQNLDVIKYSDIEIEDNEIISKYLSNKITKSIVIGGLEPLDTFSEVYWFIDSLREIYGCHDDVVIYTGYYPQEVEDKILQLKNFDNIVIKYGRFIPDQESHLDEVLGVMLASDNQWAERIS